MAEQITKDGRRILTGRQYSAFRHSLFKMQNGQCASCGRATDLKVQNTADYSFQVHHVKGRGGKRNDDVHTAHKPGCVGWCGKCHRMHHGQQSAVQSQPHWSRV